MLRALVHNLDGDGAKQVLGHKVPVAWVTRFSFLSTTLLCAPAAPHE
jgi:hypothetical protein